MALLGLYIWWAVIPMARQAVERRNREIERGHRERLGLSTESSPDAPEGTSGFSSQLPLSRATPSQAGETPKEIR